MSARFVSPTFGEFAVAAGATMDTLKRYGPLVATVKSYGITIVPDDWVPWLIYDLGLEDVTPYVRDYRKVLAEAPAWQARRGTPDGIAIGIGWVDSAGAVEPPDGRHDWWEFQVGFPEPAADIEQIRQFEGIIRLSKASEDELFRMFSPARDHRPVRFDRHRHDNGGQFDGYSGEVLWPGGPLISFGWASTVVVDIGPQAGGGTAIETSVVVPYFEGMRFDRDRRDRRRPLPIASSGVEIETSAAATKRGDTWPRVWPGGSWSVETDAEPISAPLEVS